MAWLVNPVMVDALRLSLEKFSDSDDLRVIGEKCEQIAMEVADIADISWCRVREDRPEVTVRRDVDTSVSVFRGRSVCLWGCGAIGSHVAYLLTKAGVGRLVLVDSGDVTPGLLVRQMFTDADIGENKTSALKKHLLAYSPSTTIDAYASNVLRDLDSATDCYRGCEYLLDCTASDVVHGKLEYVLARTRAPRIPMISMVLGRRAEHGITVIVPTTHTGGLRDVFRKAKIAACQEPLLNRLCDDFYPQAGMLQFFQPEPGCSDATFVGSAADVSALSSMMLNGAAGALLRPDCVATALFAGNTIAVRGRRMGALDNPLSWSPDIVLDGTYTVRLSPRVFREVLAWIRRSRRERGRSVETGGVLFGKRDDAARIVWVDAVSGPPPDSQASRTAFICGTKGVREEHEAWRERTRGSVEFAGMWHTHPDDMPLPSRPDLRGMTQVLTIGKIPPSKCLLLIVGCLSSRPLVGACLFEREQVTKETISISANISMREISEFRI